mgnify:CR=1 FL=1
MVNGGSIERVGFFLISHFMGRMIIREVMREM